MRFLVLLLLLVSCNQASDKITLFTGNAMTIDYRIIVGKNLSPHDIEKIEQTIQHIFVNVNHVYNKWNPHSEISLLNRLKAGVKVKLSSELEQFLHKTGELVAITEGRFDPTIEPIQQLWKSYLNRGEIPSEAEIEAIRPAVGWENILIEDGMFSKRHDLTSLDLGGIAKGYCVDLLVEEIVKLGYPDVYVEWGGEIRAAGKHPDNRPWRIFISRFGNTDPEQAIAKVDLIDQAIATSGDYLQNWEVNGIKYFHIFNPKTFRPLVATSNSVASASVLAPTCMFGDGLATAAMMFSDINEAQTWLLNIQEQYPDIQFWLM